MKTPFKFLLLLAATAFMFACSDDDDNTQEPDNDEEEITSVIVNLNDGTTDTSFKIQFDDAGGTIVNETIMLAANTTYTATLEFLNEEESPVEDVTEEILDEDDEHLICFEVSTATNVGITTTDQDENGLEVGLASTWAVGDPGSGTVTITLKHQPDLKASPVNCNIGETDIEASFAVTIS